MRSLFFYILRQIIGPFLEDRTVIDVAADIAELTGGFVPPPGY